MRVRAGMGMLFSCTCVRCAREREVPETDRSRMPATGPDGAVTVETDEACTCGSKRVRIALEFG